MTADELRERERALRASLAEHMQQAPNPRDFPSWDAFYAAQAQHESRAAEIEAEVEEVVQAAWAL